MGEIISDSTAKMKRWQSYFETLLNPTTDQQPVRPMPVSPRSQGFTDLHENDSPPSVSEISECILKLKNYKSCGVDNISNEELKYGSSVTVRCLENIFRLVWTNEHIPEDWEKGVIVIVPKKGDTSVCSNNRGITLRCTSSKLFQVILLRRLADYMEKLLRDNQCGFRRNRSCSDQLFTLKVIIDNALEYNLPLKINFIDFKAAFDSVDREFIWSTLHHYGLPQKYIRIFKAFYANTQSAVKVDGKLTEWFNVMAGTGQGDIQAPPLFNVVINFAMELAMISKSVSGGFTLQKRLSSRIPAKYVTDADYADDLAVLDDSKDGLQESTNAIADYCSLGGLTINVKKTKCMNIAKYHKQRPFTENEILDIDVYGKPIDQVTSFTYLGSVISSDGSLDDELTTRIGKASGGFNAINNIWVNKGISLKTKVRIYKAAIITILTYGAEVWSPTSSQISHLEVFKK